MISSSVYFERATNLPKNAMSDQSPSVTVLILNWNGQSLLTRCLSALLALDYPTYRLIVVDNGSTDNSVEMVKAEFPEVSVIEHGRNLGFSKGLNEAIRMLPGEAEILVLLNNDIFVSPDWLTQLVAPFADPAVGVAGCKLLYPDGRHIQHAGGELIYPVALTRHYHYQEVDEGQADEERDVPYVTGAALAVRASLVDESGLFDEFYSPIYFEEVDLCYRLGAAGHRVVYAPKAVAIHNESFTTQKHRLRFNYAFQRNRLRFVLRHYTVEQFRDDFVPAEIERLHTTPASAEDLDIMSRVYLESILSLTEYDVYGIKRAETPTIWAALDRLWQASIAVEPHRVPGFAYGVPLLEPVVKGLIDLWSAMAARLLLWPVMRQQHTTNALLSRLIVDRSLATMMTNRDGEAPAGDAGELSERGRAPHESVGRRELRPDEP